MSFQRISSDWLGLSPFWRKVDSAQLKTIVVDVPHTPAITPFNGIEINGFVSYESLSGLYYYPPELESRLARANCYPVEFFERYEPFRVEELIRVKAAILQQIQSLANLGKFLIDNETWDLCMIVFSATHRSGHRFWQLSNLRAGEDRKHAGELANSLKDIYRACDQAIGSLVENLPEDTRILICSLHGMGANQSRTEVLPDMLEKVLSGNKAEGAIKQAPPKWINAVRQRVPNAWRHAVKTLLPVGWQDKLTFFWRVGSADWRRIPAFALIGDYFGAVQVNLKGRERDGIVSQGEEYIAWLKIIEEGLFTFVDSQTGEAIVENIYGREALGLDGEFLHRFPDLVVLWKDTPAAQHEAIVSERYGQIKWPAPYRNPDGRSGNHRSQGFFIGVGEPFAPNSAIENIRIVDLAPTILTMLGQPPFPEMEGTLLTGVTRNCL
jgi:predicted AlkP superfamily phosphohydrolase/phosphomutase